MKNLFYQINEKINKEIKEEYNIRYYLDSDIIELNNKDIFLYQIYKKDNNILIYQIDNENLSIYQIFSINILSFEEREEILYNIIINYLNNLLDY